MESKKPPEHQAVVDAARYKGLTPRQRQDEEAEAVKAVLKRIPESRRDAFRKALEDPNAVSGGSLDPETARHLGVIFSLRALAAEELQEKARLQDEALLDAAGRVRIRIAIVQSLPRSGGYGVVIRSPEDGGVPLLVF